VKNFIVLEKPVPARQRNAALSTPITAGHSAGSQQRRSPGQERPRRWESRKTRVEVITRYNCPGSTGILTSSVDLVWPIVAVDAAVWT